MIEAEQLRRRLATLEPIGLGERGTNRLAWTPEDAQAGEWFAAQAHAGGLRVERDAAGNRWALPAAAGPWWAVGSHLDSVRDGGRFDGALGVAAAFEIAARCSRPLAVIAFADEEGARFNTPTFGSRALTGALDVASVLARADADGVSLAAAMAGAGVEPGGLARAERRLADLEGFVELHIDQSREVAALGVPYAVVSRLAARIRVALELHGRADHAGTTSMEERSDALAAAARVVVAALEAAGAELRVTPTRLLAEPGALTTIAARARLWLDARATEPAALSAWLAAIEASTRAIAAAARVDAELQVESRSDGARFDPALCARLQAIEHAPLMPCFAGHDAGVVSLRRPAAMVLVRNATGVSHAREEEVDLADAAAGTAALLTLLERL